MGCHFLLQRVFLTQASNPCLLHLPCWQANSLPLSHLGSPGNAYKMLKESKEAVALYVQYCSNQGTPKCVYIFLSVFTGVGKRLEGNTLKSW